MPFFDRKRELSDIGEVLASRRPELIVIYGRRGVGKSTLLAEALSGRPHIYYQATTRALPQQLEDITAALRTFAPETVVPGVLPSLDAALRAIAQISRSRAEPIIVVIDELPYLAQADPATPTVLQRWWDELRRQGTANVKLFLLGSLVSWMEEQTLSERGPLHNRRTGQIRLDALGYRDAALFCADYVPEELVASYAIWGGMPSYLEEIRPELSLWENVRESILRPGARLAEEPRWLRFSDLRSDAVYASILRAIAQGERRPGKIAQAVGRARADDVAFQLERLCDIGLVRRVVPINEAESVRSRHALYVLADHYVAFWYRFVDRLRHLLAMRRYDDALLAIQEGFGRYVSESAFEDICRQFLWEALASGRLPERLQFDQVGSWWVAKEDLQDEVDVVAMSGGRAVLAGECKWSRQPSGARELEGLGAALHKGSRDLRPADRPWRAIFSRAGFADELRALADDPEERILLFTPSDLYW